MIGKRCVIQSDNNTPTKNAITYESIAIETRSSYCLPEFSLSRSPPHALSPFLTHADSPFQSLTLTLSVVRSRLSFLQQTWLQNRTEQPCLCRLPRTRYHHHSNVWSQPSPTRVPRRAAMLLSPTRSWIAAGCCAHCSSSFQTGPPTCGLPRTTT